MNYFDKRIGIILVISVIFIMSGCSYMVKQPLKTEPPKVGLETNSEERLQKLPEPANKVTAAVYNFRDKTGQYKMSSQGGGSWSTAVTQGAASVLIETMEESGWFVPIERAGLGNLLNERKIIRSSRKKYDNSSQSGLPPLMFAGVMIEGGIISYDHNVKTGGAGLRYFGAGASGEYRQDRVTVYLRAISTKNGKVLKSVNSTKTVLSQKIDAGIFRYVKVKRLLEAETGVTYNEPTQLALKSAIAKALESLIIEGLFDDLWQLKNPEAINSDIIQTYVKEKEERKRTDKYGIKEKNRPYSFKIGVNGGPAKYDGDYAPSIKRPLLNLDLGYRFNKNWSTNLSLGNIWLAAKPDFNKGFSQMSLGMEYDFTPERVYTPFVAAEFGAFTQRIDPFQDNLEVDFDNLFYNTALSGGIRYYIDDARKIGIEAFLKYNYFFTDNLDGVVHGSYNDFIWQGNIGLSFSF